VYSRLKTTGLITTVIQTQSRHSPVGIATGYRLDDRGVRVRIPVGSRIFPSVYRPVGVLPEDVHRVEALGRVVVKTLFYKPEGHGLENR
jgi:hypothetical protein